MRWREVELGDVCDRVTVGHVGPMAAEYLPNGIPFLRSKNVREYRIVSEDLRFVSADFHQRLKKSRLVPGDVVIVRTGTPGTAAVIPPGIKEANCSDLVVVTPGPGLLSHFLAYYLNAAAHRQIDSAIVGAVQQHFNVGSARKLRIPLPPMAEQAAIVTVLRHLDDKIELNREMNRTLEVLAQAIFRSWFVDFDPVVAKAEGRVPFGMDADTAALFPDRFVDSELGPIPEGWEVRPLAHRFEVTAGQSPPGSSYNEEGQGVPFYQGRRDFGQRFPTRRVYCTDPRRFAEAGDTVVSVRAPVGDANQAWERCSIGRGLAAVRCRTGCTSFTYYSILHLAPEFAVFEGSGSVFGSISKREFEAIKIVDPGALLVERFQTLAGPFDDLVRSNWLESQTLTSLRDLLLPKLLSGEIRVPEAAEMVEDVA